MIQVKAGDKSAFRIIVEKYQQRVINVAYRILGDPEDAEEIAQETFLKAYLSAKSYKPQAELFTYLYTIVTHLALNRLRKKRRLRWFSLDSLDDSEGGSNPEEILTDPTDRPDEALERTEREEVVRRALASLPPAQKAAMVLSRYEGLSYSQIAEVMDISVSAVESKLYRAKQTLKKKLTPYLEDI
jgi:RNA polymerase sigma-70 factor (ECF subfamily)